MPSTTKFEKGELVLVAFPYSSGSQTKVRPAMVVLDTGDADVVIARMTTQRYSTPHDVPLHAWKSSGLLAPTIIRLHNLTTVEKQMVQRTLGTVQSADRTNIALVLRQVFSNR